MAYFPARRSLASLLTRTLSSRSYSSSLSSRSRFALALLVNYRPQLAPDLVKIPTRFKTSGSGYSPLNDPSPNWSNRPPKETIILEGCDYEHWLIVMEFPTDPKPSEEEMINSYVKTLANVVGRYYLIRFFNDPFFLLLLIVDLIFVYSSEEEAKSKIYSVCTTTYTGFGALISEELSYKVKGKFFGVL